jgi:HD superfamily phosphohydrolase
MWRVIQTRPFQRLRRIKQLGFSEFVYPGATHTRFAHSIGAFHIGRRLDRIIQDRLGKSHEDHQAWKALAACLVHDLGHGPFSHAFEEVGDKLGLAMAHHEEVSDALIRDSEVSEILNGVTSGFSADVASVVKSSGPANIYNAIVSSQFDADRLDYMQRDRLMTGTHHGAIDFDWMLANLEVGAVPWGVDATHYGDRDTLVLGPKASAAAESYLLGLFHLYSTVYLHKATRGAEKLFTQLLIRVIGFIRDDSRHKTGLPENHPLTRFALEPSPETILLLDDSIIWGSLSMMAGAEDADIQELSERIRDRKLWRCIDIRGEMERAGHREGESIDRIFTALGRKIEEWLSTHPSQVPRILVDRPKRPLYSSLEESKGPLNQIMIRSQSGKLVDVNTVSSIIKESEPLKLMRVYLKRDDNEAVNFLLDSIKTETKNGAD